MTSVATWTPSSGSRVPPPLPATYPDRVSPWGPLAGWWPRAGAALLDALLALPGALLLWVPGNVLLASADTPGSAGWAAFLCVAGFVAMWAPYLWSRVVLAGRTGQSWGRRVVGIRLVAERTGQPVGAAACFARELLHGIDGAFCLGYLRAAWHPKGRTVADSAVGSIVVRA